MRLDNDNATVCTHTFRMKIPTGDNIRIHVIVIQMHTIIDGVRFPGHLSKSKVRIANTNTHACMLLWIQQ